MGYSTIYMFQNVHSTTPPCVLKSHPTIIPRDCLGSALASNKSVARRTGVSDAASKLTILGDDDTIRAGGTYLRHR
jgi:hypothetical protein